MTITATELKMNLGKYLELSATEDVLITKNGKAIALLTSPEMDKLSILESLLGICENVSETNESIKESRLAKQ